MEIVIRAAVVFVFLWIVTRAVGRTTLGELSTFQLLLYVTMGDLVQQSVTQQDFSVTGGLLAVGTFAVLTVALSWAQWRFPPLRDLVTGRPELPELLVRDGEMQRDVMRRQRLSVHDLHAAAREQGIRSIDEVELAVFEANGRISFFSRDSSSGAPETPEVG